MRSMTKRGWDLPWALTLLVLGAGCSQESTPARAAPPVAKAQVQERPRLPPLPPGGEDFAAEVRLLHRVVACGGDEPLPASLDRATVDEHCAWLLPRLETYRQTYLKVVTPFLAARRPQNLPFAVVYPFGGGDLLSALTTYPDGLEFTTLSLEHAGDPRRIAELDKTRLARSLDQLRRRIRGLFAYAESTSENLMQMQRGDLPGELSFFLVGLSAHGYEPVGLRYFRVQADGTLRYVTREELAADEGKMAPRLNRVWVSPDFSEVFSNAEIAFRSREGGPDGGLRVHRHIAANLADAHLKADPSVLRHLEAKGKVAAMTKAASYLLCGEGFSRIRGYLLSHMAFMISDSTGILPSYATKAGFRLETYGTFKGPMVTSKGPLAVSPACLDEFLQLWSSQPHRDLPFRYGYPDSTGQNHLVIAKPAPAPSPPAGT
jgi:hypothetical protein